MNNNLIWNLVKSAKEIEITNDFLRRYKSANIGDVLEIKGFWNVNSRLLNPYFNFRSLEINGVLGEIRLEHEINKGELVILSLTPEQKNSLGMLDDYTYLNVIGKKRKMPTLFNSNSERITPNIPLLEVDEIKREKIEEYYENDALARNFDINKASNLLYDFIPDNHIAEGTIINLLNTPVAETKRTRGIIPLVFTQNLGLKDRRNYSNNYKMLITQLLNENESKISSFRVNCIGEKKLRGEIDYLIKSVGDDFGASNEDIKSADAPILVRRPVPIKGVAFNSFDNDDLSYLKIFKKLVLIFRSSIPSVKERDFDDSYVENFINVINDLPDNKKYYYLGLTMHDRVISAELNIDYGRKLDIAHTLSKDKNKDIILKSKFAFAEDLVMNSVDNKSPLIMDNQIYKDGVMLSKKGFGSFRREIAKIRKVINDTGGYSINNFDLSRSIGSEISFNAYDNLQRHGLIVKRLNNKISLHPSLFN